MAYSNRQVAYTDVTYPELRPVAAYQKRTLHSRQRKHATRAEHFRFLAINVALIFGLAQCFRAVISDSLNLSFLMNSQAAVSQFKTQTLQENRQLSDKIRIYSSASGIEELARNYLNMVGANELPIRFQ